MPKVLGQAGTSLADVYDVEGSQAGVDQLVTKDVVLVHEMGATIFSERASGTVRRSSTGAIAQNITWDIVLADLPSGMTRILGVGVIADVAARVSIAQVSVRDPRSGREFPIFVWQSSVDNTSVIRIVENDGASGNQVWLGQAGASPGVPSMLFGDGQPQRVLDIAFRGSALSFGAGTVTVTLLLYIGFSQVGGLSSKGLPLPSW